MNFTVGLTIVTDYRVRLMLLISLKYWIM